MAAKRLLVIGGDAAGMSAAAKVRRLDEEMEILVLERSPHTSYSACGLPYYAGRLVESEESLVVRTPEQFKEKYRIEALTGQEVINIDPQAARVEVVVLDSGKRRSEPFDQLLIATGAHPLCPDLPGSDADGIFGLCTLQSGVKIRRALDERQPRRAVIVGGGYIGLEMAEALQLREMEVSMVSRSPEPMKSLDPDMGQRIAQSLEEMGVRLYFGETLKGFETAGEQVRAVVTDRHTLPTDLVILGMGVRPNAALAEQAGIACGAKGAIRVNPRMQTGSDGIWAAGDCAESFHLVSRQPFYVALGTVANKQGVVAGTNLGGGYATFAGVVGTAVTRVGRTEIGRTGLSTTEAEAAGLLCETAVITSRTRAGYFPGAGSIAVKVIAERGSGRLLGGQIVGMEGSAKRIDTLATALHAGMTVDQVAMLDLGYAPPFSPVWDPVQMAARQLARMV